MCIVESGFPSFPNQTVAMRPLTTVAGIPFMNSWSSLQQNFMVLDVDNKRTHINTHKKHSIMITIRSLCLQTNKERERERERDENRRKASFMTLVILKVGHPAAVHSHVLTAQSMCFHLSGRGGCASLNTYTHLQAQI